MQFAAENPEIADRWQRVQDFIIDDQSGKGSFFTSLCKDTQWDQEFARQAICEYKKFMFLRCVYPARDLTPSVFVDTVWHLHLLYTINYQRFCAEALDSDFLHHEPSKGGAQEKEKERNSYMETLQSYLETFAVEPPIEIWGRRPRAGSLNPLRNLFE